MSTDLRSNPQSSVYIVELGEHLDSFWGKKLSKISKKFKVRWETILEGLIEEYKVFDIAEINGGRKYNLLKISSDGKYKFYKIEVKFYPQQSASGGGCRAGVFVIKGEKVIIVFAGLHENLDKYCDSNNDCQQMMEVLKKNYKNLFDLLSG